MAVVHTDLRNTRETAKRIRFEPNGENLATNVQDAIDRTLGIAGIGTAVAVSAANSPYTVPPDVSAVLVTTSAGPVTVNVGLSSLRTVNTLTVKDESGNADVNNITINTSTPPDFGADGQTSLTIDRSFMAYTLRKKTGGFYIT